MSGNNDNLNASLAHVVLCCVAGQGIGQTSGRSFTHPGMHANFFIHGILGVLNHQKEIIKNDLGPAYNISYKATRYLALPCLMADLYRGNSTVSTLHLLSGIAPFLLLLAGEDNAPLGNLVITGNIISLCYYSATYERQWGWCTAGAAVFAYTLTQECPRVLYPLGLSLVGYCALRLFHTHFTTSST